VKHPVVHFEIWGPDREAIQSFYDKAFDWNLRVMQPGDYGMTQIDAEGGINGGVMGAHEQGPQSGLTIYIATNDIDAHLQRLEGAGAKTLMPKTVIPDMVTFAQFADPWGNVVGLVEWEMPKAAKKKGAKKKAGKKKVAKAEKKPAKKKAAKKRNIPAPKKRASKKGK